MQNNKPSRFHTIHIQTKTDIRCQSVMLTSFLLKHDSENVHMGSILITSIPPPSIELKDKKMNWIEWTLTVETVIIRYSCANQRS